MESEDDAFFQALQKEWAFKQAGEAAEVYLLSRDGRYIWRALLEFHRINCPLPQNLYDKFAQIGHRLLKAQDDDEIARALEFKGDEKRHIGPKHSLKVLARVKVARHVQEVMANPKFTLGRAVALVAQRRNLSPAKVKADYHKVFEPKDGRPTKASRSAGVKTLSQVMSVWGSPPKS